jgi:putative ABC transport system substrate-binding protein
MWYSAVGFLVTLTLSLLAAPRATTAQPRTHIPRVGVLEPGTPQIAADVGTCHHGFRQGLRDLGYVEGHNLLLEYRYAEGQPDRLPALAAELVRLTPDVLWTHGGAGARVAKQATTTVPIVIGVTSELIEQGLAESLARPGGNLTGLELRDLELAGTRLELLKQAVPTLSRIAVLVDPAVQYHVSVPSNFEAEARTLGVQLQRVEVGTPDAFEGAFAAMVQTGADALMIMEGAFFARHRHQLLALALRHRLPTMSGGRHFAEAGSLLAYGAYPRDLCQRSAVLVDKILKGAKPGDLVWLK